MIDYNPNAVLVETSIRDKKGVIENKLECYLTFCELFHIPGEQDVFSDCTYAVLVDNGKVENLSFALRAIL